ncbi:receptor-like protein 47 [Salvia divinorum]|uniref:Receptor-like protein 47 n=1 Tax=Salvia divinorum TaxID=28513 RepID=A0ABD1HJC3_SALDI
MISKKTIAIKFLLLLLLCVFASGDAEVRCIEREREALLSFKNGLIDDDSSLSSWRRDECCEWHGVECSNTTGHVITLQCDNCGLQGEIGSSLLELHHLIDLDLSMNDFGGIQIPGFIGSMKQLQHLFLSRSNFSGSIPPQLGNLTNLRSLDLSYNPLSLISPFIFGFVFGSLETMDLSYNQFTGLMPDLRAFPSLINLDLSGNNFTGSIPVSIGQLSKLQVLDLSRNSLEGLVSESHFSKLHKLKTLDLSFNSLILDIAPDWSPPFQLNYIYLAGCSLGSFPKWIQTQMNLSHLDLRGANITDEAPRWLWNMPSSLHRLYLSDNQISGTVPNLSSTSIKLIDLSYNQFSGHIPPFPINASIILLSGNMLSGAISSICKTRKASLNYLDLSNNQLEGEVPNCWEKMPKLYTLNLANNSFSGEIPLSLGDIRDLTILRMHGNHFSGELPNSLRFCQRLRFIDVEGNKIPTWIGFVEINCMEVFLPRYAILLIFKFWICP